MVARSDWSLCRTDLAVAKVERRVLIVLRDLELVSMMFSVLERTMARFRRAVQFHSILLLHAKDIEELIDILSPPKLLPRHDTIDFDSAERSDIARDRPWFSN